MLGEYIRLIRDYPRFLTFSSLHMFFSGPGQSFSFALFAPSFAAVFALGAGGFGTLYSAATLVSAALMPLFGPIIDRIDLRICSVFVGLLMAGIAPDDVTGVVAPGSLRRRTVPASLGAGVDDTDRRGLHDPLLR